MIIEVTFDKLELEEMLKNLLKRQGLKLASTEDSIRWMTRKGFRVVVKAEVDPSAATQAAQEPQLSSAPEGEDDGTQLDLSMFPNPAAAAGLAKEDGLAGSIPQIPGETPTRQNDPTKKPPTGRKPTRKDRKVGR